MDIKIIIADDHKLFRQGLRNLLEKQSGIKIVGEAGDGIAVMDMAQELLPHIIIMDISMPELNGIEATRRILSKNPNIKIIALSMHSDQRFVIEILKNGALGYLLKDSAFEEVMKAIGNVMKNEIYLSNDINNVLVKDYINNLKKNSLENHQILSSREKQVLHLITEGKTSKQIALQFQVSVKTIDAHRKQIMDKLNIHSLPELTKYAIREGITSL